jgi:hypothetical protein
MVGRVCKAHILCGLAVLWLAGGCGSGYRVAEVEGVVKSAGKPVPHLRIQFMPDPEKGTNGPTSSGTTDEEGRFTLVCADKRAGAVVGWHRVVITDLGVRTFKTVKDDDGKAAAKGKPQANRVPDKYTSVAQTPLHVEVKSEKQEMAFDLTR